ncbi:MAG: hypothetical protein PHS54_06650 [Clostridia bacterium]|nr:hypothetical protein [Clostridia bacterium]
MDYEFILKVKQELDSSNWNYERKEIIKNAVKELRERGYSDDNIRELFKIQSLKEQDNSQMVNNNARYLELLNEILNS